MYREEVVEICDMNGEAGTARVNLKSEPFGGSRHGGRRSEVKVNKDALDET